MGFPIRYTEEFLPKIFVHTLSFLGIIRNFIICLFCYLGLSDFLETDVIWPENNLTRRPENPTVSTLLIREILPVVKFQDLEVNGNLPENCAVCLFEFEGSEEIRWLRKCKHIFHRACLDPWMDHDQKTCPLCRIPFVPDEMQEEFNQRLWAAIGDADLYTEYSSVPGL